MKNEEKTKKPIAAFIAVAVIVAAAAGVLIYRNNVINTARNEALSAIEAFDTEQYDGDELDTINNYVADAKSRLEASKDKEEFTAIVEEFNKNTAGVKTTAQKEEERIAAEKAAEKKAAEEAAARAAAQKSSSGKKGKDSSGCVGGGSDNFY